MEASVRSRDWRRRDPGKRHADNLKRKYGLTVEAYEALQQLHPVCAICKTESEYALQVDHCHETGVVRGLLCFRCNRGLGFFRDDPLFLEAAISYLINGGA